MDADERIRQLELRVASLEARLSPAPPPPPQAAPPRVEAPPLIPTKPRKPPNLRNLEAQIGEKWVGWVAILLIFCSAAFFLKYAFENGWIGEIGRVTLGVIAGLAFVWGGFDRHRKGWRYISQVFTSGGVVILYLSIYGAFAYYHLIDQTSAFLFLAVLVAEAHLLALVYDAPAIAITALIGGFLVPILLSTGRDQYRALFTYIGALDAGVLSVVLARRWRWVASIAYLGTQLLFWAWYTEHYHPDKRAAVLVFQLYVFLLFTAVALAPTLRRAVAGWEEWVRLAVNPFVFFGIAYGLLDDDYHVWMGTLALGMAVLYAALARAELALCPTDRRALFLTLGTALTFVTLAIPIQLKSNWITIAWGVEGATLLWASIEANARPLRILSHVVFGLALARFCFIDTHWSGSRAPFTLILNRYFLGSLALAACLCAAWRFSRRTLVYLMLAAGVVWLCSSVEAYTWFDARAGDVTDYEAARQIRWGGQLSLSLIWSVYAGLLTWAGFRFRVKAARVAGLALFGLTLVKVVIIDISELRQFYRILALLGLGLVLLRVAWAYQRSTRQEQSR